MSDYTERLDPGLQGGEVRLGTPLASDPYQTSVSYPDGSDPHITPPPGVVDNAATSDAIVEMTGPDAAVVAMQAAMGRREVQAGESLGSGASPGDAMPTPGQDPDDAAGGKMEGGAMGYETHDPYPNG